MGCSIGPFMSWAPGVEVSKRIEDKGKKIICSARMAGSKLIRKQTHNSIIVSIIKVGTWIQVLMLWCRIKKWNAPVMMGRCSSWCGAFPRELKTRKICSARIPGSKSKRKQTPQKTDRNHQHHTGHLASGVVMQHQEEMKWKFPLWWWMRCSSCFSSLLLLLLLCVFSKHWEIPSFYLSFCIPELLHPSHCCNLRTSKIVKESTGGSSSLKIDR